MGKFLKTLVSSAAVGAAVGYFLTTKKGKELKDKALDFANDYKENPEAYNQAAKEKAVQATEFANDQVVAFRDKIARAKADSATETRAEVDDIVIDYPDQTTEE